MRSRLAPFREEAAGRGIPAEDVERWLATARPCATLALSGDGPVVGRFGGPLVLPADTPDPKHPFVASVDLAALPADATDLPLPADGHLLLFVFIDEVASCTTVGSAIHVPAGTAVVERDRNAWNPDDVDDYRRAFERFPQGPMRVTTDVSLPYHCAVALEGEPWSEPPPGHPRAEELVAVWEKTFDAIATDGPLRLGGYATEEAVHTDPLHDLVRYARHAVEEGNWAGPVSDDPSDWVLLADWHVRVSGWEGATAHWGIQRDDLVARRFDRTFTTIYWNP